MVRLCQTQCGLHHFPFRHRAVSGDSLDDVPVAIPRGEVHRGVIAVSVAAQERLNSAHRFDKVSPVGRTQEPQATDAIADRDLIRGEALRFRLHQLFSRAVGFGQALFDPRQRQRERQTLALQPSCQFGDKRVDERRIRAGHIRDHQYQALRILLRSVNHLVSPVTGLIAINHPCRNAPTDAAQILDQCKPQHDRDCPELAQREISHALIRSNEAAETFNVESAIAVRNRFESNGIHARMSS